MWYCKIRNTYCLIHRWMWKIKKLSIPNANHEIYVKFITAYKHNYVTSKSWNLWVFNISDFTVTIIFHAVYTKI